MVCGVWYLLGLEKGLVVNLCEIKNLGCCECEISLGCWGWQAVWEQVRSSSPLRRHTRDVKVYQYPLQQVMLSATARFFMHSGITPQLYNPVELEFCRVGEKLATGISFSAKLRAVLTHELTIQSYIVFILRWGAKISRPYWIFFPLVWFMSLAFLGIPHSIKVNLQLFPTWDVSSHSYGGIVHFTTKVNAKLHFWIDKTPNESSQQIIQYHLIHLFLEREEMILTDILDRHMTFQSS